MKTRGRNIAERADVTAKFAGDESFNLSLAALQLIHDAIFLRRRHGGGGGRPQCLESKG